MAIVEGLISVKSFNTFRSPQPIWINKIIKSSCLFGTVTLTVNQTYGPSRFDTSRVAQGSTPRALRKQVRVRDCHMT